MLSKNQSFYFGAGKRYIDSSMVLASYGPGEKFNNAEKIITEKQ
jgi:ferrous iron transport protein B